MKDILEKRAKIVSAIRKFFDDQGFVEVETAVRIAAPAPEEHIDCPPVVGGGYLRASPELQMKKLLAAGMDKIYQIGPCFREGEKGSRHNPEFTMLEWYRREANYLDIKRDLEELLADLVVVCSRSRTEEDKNLNIRCTPTTPRIAPATQLASLGGYSDYNLLRVRDAYCEYAGWDPWASWDQDRFDFDMATKIEPAIKSLGGGVFLMDYPPQAASLAKISTSSLIPLPSSLPFAERWEFYWDGMELANCFTELCDKDEQLKRFVAAKESRKLLKESDYPVDSEFIDSLPLMGPASGVALGVDRLVMILTKTREISAVRAHI